MLSDYVKLCPLDPPHIHGAKPHHREAPEVSRDVGRHRRGLGCGGASSTRHFPSGSSELALRETRWIVSSVGTTGAIFVASIPLISATFFAPHQRNPATSRRTLEFCDLSG